MPIWKFGNWYLGGAWQEIWKFGNLEIIQFGNDLIWKLVNLEIWKWGNVLIWKLVPRRSSVGNLEIWKLF